MSNLQSLKVETLTAICSWFEVSRPTMKTWRDRGIIPAKGPYDIRAIYLAKKEHDANIAALGKSGRADTGKLAVDKLKEQVAKLKQEVRAINRENDAKDGELLPRREVEAAIVSWAVRFRTPLLGLSNKIMALVPGSQKATAERMVKDEVVAALTKIRDMPMANGRLDQLILREAAVIQKARKRGTRRRKVD